VQFGTELLKANNKKESLILEEESTRGSSLSKNKFVFGSLSRCSLQRSFVL